MRAAPVEPSSRALGILSFRSIRRGVGIVVAGCLAIACAQAQEEQRSEPVAPAAEQRLGLVIGQSDYRDARLITGTADASRVAEALKSAGFEVDGGADLEQHLIREKIRSLVEKAGRAGGAETIFVYLGGRVAQLSGDNLLLPVGAPLDRASDAVLNGFRLNDLVEALKLVPAKGIVIVIDAAAPPQQLATDKSFGPGLAIINAPKGFLIAFNQNPGRPLLEPQPPMGGFLRAFLDVLQQPVASYGDFFALVRQRVFEESKNHDLPWDDDQLTQRDLTFFRPPTGAALPNVAAAAGAGGAAEGAIASMSRDEAFKRVITSDSILDYQAFLIQFPKDEAVPTVQYNLAVRREAELWSRALSANTPQAYWTYLTTYPDGGNVEVARQRLTALGGNEAPPANFEPVAFSDLPPPLPGVEMIASSASMPVEYLPRAPTLGLPPIAPIVAAVAALPVAAAIGQQLPPPSGGLVRPSWALAVRPIGGEGLAGQENGRLIQAPASVGGFANGPLRAPSFQPIGQATPAIAPVRSTGVGTFTPLSRLSSAGLVTANRPAAPAPDQPQSVSPANHPAPIAPSFAGRSAVIGLAPPQRTSLPGISSVGPRVVAPTPALGGPQFMQRQNSQRPQLQQKRCNSGQRC